jgi:hypothetical protein
MTEHRKKVLPFMVEKPKPQVVLVETERLVRIKDITPKPGPLSLKIQKIMAERKGMTTEK